MKNRPKNENYVNHKYLCNNFDFVMSKKNNTNITVKPPKKDTISRTLTEAEKKDVASDQHYKCANTLGSNLPGLEGYECPMWLKPANKHPGSFDKSSYHIDHKVEFSISHDDSRENLQALCPCCHAVKTKSFMINKPRKSKVINVGDEKAIIFFESADSYVYTEQVVKCDNCNHESIMCNNDWHATQCERCDQVVKNHNYNDLKEKGDNKCECDSDYECECNKILEHYEGCSTICTYKKCHSFPENPQSDKKLRIVEVKNFYFLFSYSNQIICEMESHMTSGEQLSISSIGISPKFIDNQYIGLILDKFIDYIRHRYPLVTNYLFYLGTIRSCLCKGCICYRSSDNYSLVKNFIDQLSKNCHCFYKAVEETINSISWAVLPVIESITQSIQFKRKNVCDLLLYFQNDYKQLFPYEHPRVNKDLLYIDKLTNHGKKIDPLKLVSYKLNFSVKRYAKNGKVGSDFKYTLISIVFDEPIIFTYESCHEFDIMMKFIVGPTDYTSENGEMFDFTYKYRLNKLLSFPNPDNNLLGKLYDNRPIILPFENNNYICTIYGFSCFEKEVDHTNYHYDTKKSRIGGYNVTTDSGHTRLYTMMRNIYATFK